MKVGWAGYGGREVILTDTVGFIRDLPKDLFAAFRATFEEAADADLLLHVLDAADPARELHRATTLALLEDLELSEIPRITVYNKADLLEPYARRQLLRADPGAVLLSATDRETTRGLIEAVATELAARWDESASVPDVAVAVEEDALEPSPVDDAGQSTLEEMLAASGRRARKGRAGA